MLSKKLLRFLFACLVIQLWGFPSLVLAADQVLFYHTDPVGTPLAMTDGSGNVVWQADYKPFGEENSITGGVTNNKRFVGKEKDSETGLDYFGARYMNDKIGRFISIDPVKAVDEKTSKTNEKLLLEPQHINTYAYAHNNPMKWIDPDGRKIFLVGNGNADYINEYSKAVNYLARDRGMLAIIRSLEGSSTNYIIVMNDYVDDNAYYPNTHTIYWNPHEAKLCTSGGRQSPALALGHEMAHASDDDKNSIMHRFRMWRSSKNYNDMEEERVITGPESAAARTLGEGIRKDHSGKHYTVRDPTSR